MALARNRMGLALRRGRLGVLLGMAVATLVACRGNGAESASGAPAASANSAATQPTGGAGAAVAAAAADAGTAQPSRLELAARAVSGSGAVALESTGNTDVPVDVRFEVDMPRLADVRVRLFDEADRLVESRDRAEFGERTQYSLSPNAPLTPGSKYALVIDGQLHELATDPQGRSFEVVRMAMRTAGEKPRPAEKRPTSRTSSKKKRAR